MREVFSPIGRWLLRPTSIGAAYLLVLVLYVARRSGSPPSDGAYDALVNVAASRFGDEGVRSQVAIRAAAVVLGAGLGLVASWLIRIRDRLAKRPTRSTFRLAWRTLWVVALGHAFFELWAMADSPALYADAWYAKGGASRTVQVLATDVFGPRVILVLGLVGAMAFVAGPVSQWRRWPARIGKVLALHHRRHRRIAAGALLGFGALAAVLALCTTERRMPLRKSAPLLPREGPPNILVLAVDSLRADRLHPRVAPHLSAFADQGTRFNRAYVSLASTLPSWVTLLTGRYPHHHGIRTPFPSGEARAMDFDALPARLRKAGYVTRVVSDGAGELFVDLGFERVDAPRFDARQLLRQRAIERQTPLLPLLQSTLGHFAFPALRGVPQAADPRRLADEAVAAIRDVGDRPWFLTVFFSSSGLPYAAPPPAYTRFTKPAYRGRFKYQEAAGLEGEAPLDDDDITQIRGLYDASVASVDAAAQRILEAVGGQSTIVVLTSDHGDRLQENGRGGGHGAHLFGDEDTHIPLVIFDSRSPRGQNYEGVVRDVDLAPTLYDLAGVSRPQEMDGVSLAPALRGEGLDKRFAFAETDLWPTAGVNGLDPSLRLPYPNLARTTEIAQADEIVLKPEAADVAIVAKHRMVRDDRYKLVYVPTRPVARYFLFDTVHDPAETDAIVAPAVAALLKTELWRWMLSDRRMVERDGLLVLRAVSGAATEVHR